MAENLNLSVFSRAPFVRPDGTLTREALIAMAVVQRRTGDLAGLVYADTITNVPAGGISSANVQDALNELDTEKQPKDATLTALAALATVADRLIYATGSDAFALTTFTAFARTLLDDVDAAAARSTLGLGTMSTQDASNVAITGGSVTTGTGDLGYSSGNGGTANQGFAFGKASGVTLNERFGEITMDNAALAAGVTVSFTLTNSTIAANDYVHVKHQSGGTQFAYDIRCVEGAGSAAISVKNTTGGSLSEAIVLRFYVFKGSLS